MTLIVIKMKNITCNLSGGTFHKGDIIVFPESVRAIIVDVGFDGTFHTCTLIAFKEYKWKFFMWVQFALINAKYNLSKHWKSLIKMLFYEKI